MLPHPILVFVLLAFIPLHSLHLSFTFLPFLSCPFIFPSVFCCMLLSPTLRALTNFLSSSQLSLHFSPHLTFFLLYFQPSLSFFDFIPPSAPVTLFGLQLRSGETAAIVARELAEQTKGLLRPGDVPSTVRAMAQLVELLDVQLRNLTPGGKDSAARSLTKVMQARDCQCLVSD